MPVRSHAIFYYVGKVPLNITQLPEFTILPSLGYLFLTLSNPQLIFKTTADKFYYLNKYNVELNKL